MIIFTQISVSTLPSLSLGNCPVKEINDLKHRTAQGLPQELLSRYELGMQLMDLINQCFLENSLPTEKPTKQFFFRKKISFESDVKVL